MIKGFAIVEMQITVRLFYFEMKSLKAKEECTKNYTQTKLSIK